MASHFKVHELLNRAELDELEAFAREPGRTVDECEQWLLERGFAVSHGAVGNWKREFSLKDRFGAANESARALMAAAKEGGTVAITDAAALSLGQMIFEQMIHLQDRAEIDTKELWGLSMALKNVVTGKRHVEKLKTEIASAVAEAKKLAADGASGDAVVAKVREILGVKEEAA